MPEAELDQQMLEFAGQCILPFRLGELVQDSKTFGADIYSYVFRELYDGVETGTGVWIDCLSDGTVSYAAVTRGETYEKTEDGAIVPLYSVNLTEEQAREIALEALHERVDGTGYEILEDSLSMKREACKDHQFFTLEAKTYSEKEQYTVTYWVRVDVSDGSVYEIEFTQ